MHYTTLSRYNTCIAAMLKTKRKKAKTVRWRIGSDKPQTFHIRLADRKYRCYRHSGKYREQNGQRSLRLCSYYGRTAQVYLTGFRRHSKCIHPQNSIVRFYKSTVFRMRYDSNRGCVWPRGPPSISLFTI